MLREPAARTWPARGALRDLALIFGTYAVLAFLAIVAAREPTSIATIWVANGAAIALLASAPPARWLGLLLAAGAGNLLANLAYGDSLALSLAFVPPNLAEVTLGAVLVHRTAHGERFGNDHQTFLRVLAAGALLPPVLGATLGAATLQSLGFTSFTRVWADWYIGAALGGVVSMPLVMALRAGGPQAALVRLCSPALLATCTATAATALLSLGYLPYPFVAISLVLIVVAFTRPRLDTFASTWVLVAALAAALALGWYIPAVPNTPLGRVLIFLAALLTVLPVQVLAVVLANRRALTLMLSAVGSHVDNVIIFVDMDGVYRWVNRAHEIYWGVPDDAVLGRRWAADADAPHYSTLARPLLEQALAGEVVRQTVDLVFPSRGQRTIDVQMQPARDEDGHQIGVLYSGTDVTALEASRRELQRTAEQLQVANHDLEQFVRIASHDMREPLNTIAQFCDLIQQRTAAGLDEQTQLYFAQVHTGAERMKSMLDGVLQFVRLEETVDDAHADLDMDRLVHEVLSASLGARIQATGAVVTVAPLGPMHGHHALVSLLVQNLVSNAIKFMPPGQLPQVHITLQRQGTELRLCVQDNGIGIAAARLAELGTPFRRLHSRRHYEGTGLGLAICKRIAEQLGGRIEIQSTPDVGSCFCFVRAHPA